MELWLIVDWVIVLILHIIGFIAGIHALMHKRDSRSALGWLAVCIAIPGLGALLYLIFGLNRIKTVARKWHSRGLWKIDSTEHDTQSKAYESYCKRFDQRTFQAIIKTGNQICREKPMYGCHLQPLFDGDQAYPAMLDAINSSEETIFLCTYLFGSRGVGQLFIDAMVAAHQRGVEVKVLIDGVGGLYSWPTAAYKLRKAGVRVAYFLPLLRNWYYTMHLNLRNHRKLLLVDGRIGFTGGMNIHEDNLSNAGEAPNIHDLHFKVEGPILGAMQDVFLKGWYFSTQEPIKKVIYYDNTPKGDMLCRGIPAGPHQKYAILQNMLVAALAAAKSHVRIMTPYFVLGNTLRATIIAAAVRGVKVEVILPENNNLKFVKGAVESMLPGLIERGVVVYYRSGSFAHTKLFLVDDFVAFIGSSNLDMRSLQLNFEYNLEVYSKSLVKELSQYFESVKRECWLITLKWLNSQGFWLKLRNAFFRLFSPYL